MSTPFLADTTTKRSIKFDRPLNGLYIPPGNQTNMALGTTFTLECWVRQDSFDVSTEHRMLYQWDADGELSFLWRLYNSAGTGQVHMIVTANGFSASQANGTQVYTARLGTWQHFASVFDAGAGSEAAKYKNYVNGVLLTAGVSTVSTATGTYAATDDIRFADLGVGVDGNVADVRMWNDVRTANEIRDNKDVDLVGDEAGLVAYWPLRGDALDRTANANHMILNGSPLPLFSYSTPL